MGKFDTKNPAGVFVMENSSIQMEHGQSIPFSFSISFMCGEQYNCVEWQKFYHKYAACKDSNNCANIVTCSKQDGWLEYHIFLWRSTPLYPFAHVFRVNVIYLETTIFRDEPEKRHIFAARAEDNVVQWVIKLRQCSYEYLRSRLHTLQSKIYSITGKDPLLLVPRNEGACLWAPAVPFSTVPACTINTSSFSCHLHTNGAFTLERSKSDVQAYKHLYAECSDKTKFYTDDYKSQENVQVEETKQGFYLERSKTSGLLPECPIDASIFDNRPVYSRAAPSPPVRRKMSPNIRRVEMNQEIKVLTEQGKYLGTRGILDEAPLPPRRKVSPKNVVDNVQDNATSENHHKPNDDLITF